MLHWDSHPDLACPNEGIPAAACFMPRKDWRSNRSLDTVNENVEGKNLYDMLDMSQGGIAEWILPLILAGGLERVFWIKNNFCKQFERGQYNYQVGVECESVSIDSFLDLPEDAVVKSSLAHPYYIDDNSYIQEDLLHLKKSVELFVLEADEAIDTETPLEVEDAEKSDWILDVCLDYFFCNNPFVDDLRNISEDTCNLFIKAVTNVTFREEVEGMKCLSTPQAICYAQSQVEFHEVVRSLLEKVRDLAIGAEPNLSNFEEADKLALYYTDVSEGMRCWIDLLGHMTDYCTKQASPIDKLISIMINALPNIALPSEYDRCKLEEGLMPTSLQMKVNSFGECLRQRRWIADTFKDVPMLITMARSTDDGYTPNSIVEPLQEMVLDEIHSIYCGCACRNGKDCKLNVVLDYGEFEGSSLEELYDKD